MSLEDPTTFEKNIIALGNIYKSFKIMKYYKLCVGGGG